ncbi:MAG: peptidylprolyl isomerase [Chromatiales bacterium]
MLLAVAAFSASLAANTEDPVLVNVGRLTVTAHELEKTITSSPFGTQFTAMDEKDQALLRGNILQRLVSSKLLYLEAEQLGLAKTPEYQQELEAFRLGLLYKNYMDHLRARIQIPEQVEEELAQQYKGNADALAAAKALYQADRFRELRNLTISQLKEKYNARLLEDNIRPELLQPDTVLLSADGFEISYSDILKNSDGKPVSNPAWIKQQLFNRAELLLVAQASKQEGIDVSGMVESYSMEKLPALLLRMKISEWMPNEQVLQDYFDQHPEFGTTIGFWHVGQIVTSSYAQANALRNRILKGESLFKLAGRFSIDPYGRKNFGDMGWLKEGQGRPEVEAVLKTLNDNEVSDIVKTDAGYHLLMITDRRPGETRRFASMKDKVQQAFVSEKLSDYLHHLEKKYTVAWHIETEAGK